MTDEKKPIVPDAAAPSAPADKPAPKPAPPAIVEQERSAAAEGWQKSLLGKLGDRVVESFVASGEFNVIVANDDRFLSVMDDLKAAGYNYLSDLSSVDYLNFEGEPKRFAVAYHLYTIADNHRLRVKVHLDDGEAVPSVMHIWPTADFHEREAWDLMGIPFSGREGLTRILMPDDWTGHPLRKELAKNAGNEEYTARMVRGFKEDE